MDTRRNHPRPAPSARRRRDAGRRLAGIALVTFRQGVRLRLWLLAPLALAVAVVTDLSSPRFDPVFDAIPAAVGTSMLIMTVLAVILAVFLATYPTPAEMDSRVAYTLMTKPVSRWEIVAGKVLGLTLLLAAMLAVVGVGVYAYVRIRAADIRSLAARRLEEARGRTQRPADLNPLQAVAQGGPLATYRYRAASSGPDFDVHFAGEPPQAPGVLWVVGQSNMRLQWVLPQTTLRGWTTSGPAHVEVTLATHRAPGGDETPVKAVLRLVARRSAAKAAASTGERLTSAPAADGFELGKTILIQNIEMEVPESGTLRVPLVRAQEGPLPEGTFVVPEAEHFLLTVFAVGAKDLVGDTAGAVRLVGPGGQTVLLKKPPERVPIYLGGRPALVGAPELPRQMAAFRFDDVPAGALGEGDTAVEIAYSLDAYSPATVQPAARATFTCPETGTSRSFDFTPEGHHPTLLYLDRDFWHGGPLQVHLECLTPGDCMGLLPESVRLRLGGDPFAVHLAKGAFCVLLFGTILTATAVFVSTRISWFVSILGMIAIFAIGTVGRILLSYGVLGRLAESAAEQVEPMPGGSWLLNHVQLQGLLPSDTFNMGEIIPWPDLGASLALVLVVTALLVAAGGYLLRTREVAA